jgi:PAT family beta-lactamase induction signal transducer AmpG
MTGLHNGFLLVDKPVGPTSHDVVQAARRAIKERRIGHTGTLDPAATGLLLLCIGKATRLQQYLLAWEKTYHGEIRLGWGTTTYDGEGEPLGAPRPVPEIGETVLAELSARFGGELQQLPPPYSAKKTGGRKFYELARAGEPVPCEPKRVQVQRIELDAAGPDRLGFRVTCSSGTYLRSLAHDIGEALGCGGHLASLRRVRIGPWRVEDAVSALGIFAIGVVPATLRSLPLLYFVVVASNFAVTFVGMTTMSLMAYDTPPESKGRASGWSQAGNLGGSGLGGGAGLWKAQHLPAAWIAGAIIALFSLACCAALLFIREPPPLPRGRHYGQDLAHVARDFWIVAKSRAGALALLVSCLPLGTGAASNLWSAVAGDWRASAGTVALVTGALSGLITAAGCFIGGWASDRMDRKAAYVIYGVLMALCAAAMAAAPRSESMYVVFTCAYALLTGLCYAGFAALTLEAIGQGAAATKYEIFASLSNLPIAYMTVVDGWTQTRWSSGHMLVAEALIACLAAGLFVAVSAMTRPRAPRLAPA